MTTSEDNYKISLNYSHLKARQDGVENEPCYDIAFDSSKGIIELLGSRRILFSADAFGNLRKELINSLGYEISRQIILRFGYECGIKDGAPIGASMKSKDIGILLGTFFHGIEGIVLAKNKVLEFFEDGSLKKMNGSWLNSYEVEQHLRHHGQSNEPICWSLAGYASGFASSVLGEDLLCIETECVAMGTDACAYEIRPIHQWPQGIRDKWDIKSQNININKSLSHYLEEERQRIYQRKLLHDCFGQLYIQSNSNSVLRKYIYYVHRLVRARYTLLFNTAQKDTILLEDYIGDDPINEYIELSEEIVKKTCYFGETYLQTEKYLADSTLRLMAVPISINNTINNVAVIITDNKINSETVDKVKLLSYFCGIKTEIIGGEIIQQSLNEKLAILHREHLKNQGLIKHYSYLEDKVELLLNCILEGKGINELLLAHSPESKVLMISNYLIIFLSYQKINWSKKELAHLLNELIKDVKQSFSQKGLFFVAGRVCKQNLALYPPAFREIKTCLSIMTKLKQRDRVVYIENLGVLSILFEVNQEKLTNFVDDILGALVEYDEKNDSELLPTLSSFVKNNFNIQLTARNSFISSSTLKYRLYKVKEFMGFNFDDPEIRLRLQLAFKLTEY